MKKPQPSSSGKGHSLLLATLVIVATGAAIFFMRDSKEEESASAARGASLADTPLEIAPLNSQGRITDTSWGTFDSRPDEARRPGPATEDESESALDLVTAPGSDEEKEKKARTSLEETMKEIEGLGVYVAPASEDAPKGGR